MKYVLEIVSNFNMSSFLKCCDCMHIKKISSAQAKLQVERPKFQHNSNLDVVLMKTPRVTSDGYI